ncbi:hypothetical protein LEP1GSC202_2223 [Leptospira yanagawae serovar Saopaulo str. Sao Paulo = ATCC 700523]|uniref:Uncharacterized protein n=1 Tax=Leptospira yanagawae serovar Saopaulo str. Sao Paulo = ATCC 700523 TaxID=1249483 RepID=A0A5E8HLU2_9LEPT|nr:hypothetical protein [Leptospira yanagawae]EOQ90786.1 hypothetical protein LEP1GSC202_2223 [Leptospira yanagawae serovar Saopaulo str. Sao Paulo = ATCC 700523]
MDFNSIITELELEKNAHYVLYGNSIPQEFKRALKNDSRQKITEQLEINPSLQPFLLSKFIDLLKKGTSIQFYSEGTAAMYLAVFAETRSLEMLKSLKMILLTLDYHTNISKLISIAIEKLSDSIIPQLTIEQKTISYNFNSFSMTNINTKDINLQLNDKTEQYFFESAKTTTKELHK